MTEVDEDFDARLRRVLAVGAEHLPVGRSVPAFVPARPEHARRLPRRPLRRGVVALGITACLAATGTAAAAVVAHLTSAPVTETDQARCYSLASLAGGDRFAGTTVAATGAPGSNAQVTNALAACSVVWADGFLTLGSSEVGGTRLPSGALNPDHPVPPLVVCVLPSGVAAVFPGEKNTCATLGLPAAEGRSSGDDGQ